MKIDLITIEGRARIDFGDLETLAASIKREGLLYPPIIERDSNRLVDGERRLKACKLLGMEDIEVRFIDELPPNRRKLLELESNLRRKSFTWDEELDLKLDIHLLHQAEKGKAIQKSKLEGWSIDDSAKLFSVSHATMVYELQLAEAIKLYPFLRDLDTKGNAFKAWKRLQENHALEILSTKLQTIPLDLSLGTKNLPVALIYGNCIEEILKLPAGSIDAIISDPPYGVNLEKEDGEVTFEDSSSYTFKLIKTVGTLFAHVLKDEGRGFLFFHIGHYRQIFEALSPSLFVHPTPFIWNKGITNSNPFLQDSYESIFYFTKKKGVMPLRREFPNLLTLPFIPGAKRLHPAEKPRKLIERLVEVITDPGDTVLDPFMGCGTIPIIAGEMNRKGIGIEKDKGFYNKALVRLKKEK